MTAQPEDAFAGGDSAPSISFKDGPIGTTYSGTVTQAPSVIQARDYESGNPASWPDGNPKLTVVTRLALASGEERSLWAPKPSSMFAAISAAQKAAGSLIAVGGKLSVTLTAEKPNAANPRLNPQKIYSATYSAPAARQAPDPFESPAQAPATQQAPAQAPVVYTPEQRAAAAAAGIHLPA